MDGSSKNRFWHPPLWKWALVLVLLGCSEVLFLWKRPTPPVKVELLPFTDSPPAWDGSQPWLVISPIAGAGPIRLKTSIAMVKPSVRHDAPVNEFVVNLRNGNFKLLQTDLFVSDVMPLSLTRTPSPGILTGVHLELVRIILMTSVLRERGFRIPIRY